MLKENKKTIILTSIIILLPILIGLMLWDKLPNTMATHINFNNTADGYSSKIFTVFCLPLILLAIHLLSIVITLNDPRKINISNKIFKLILWTAPIIAIFSTSYLYAYNLGVATNVIFLKNIVFGILFIVLGNFLPKTRQNYSIGIKLPWTLASEENWNKTHRLGGILFIIAGIAMILTAFIKNQWIFFVIVMIAAIIPSIYSFYLHISKNKE